MSVRDPGTWLRMATIEPVGPVVAGSFGTWTLTIRVGRYGVDDSDALLVVIRSSFY